MPRRVYLQPRDLVNHSKKHTAYAGSGEPSDSGPGKELVKLEFENGVAENVDEGVFQRFKDLGIAGEKRPAAHPEDGDR